VSWIRPTTFSRRLGQLHRPRQKGTVQITTDCNYPYLVEDIDIGRIVIVDNGLLRMKAIEKRHNELVCEVLTPGPWQPPPHQSSRRGREAPRADRKGLRDLELAFECKMDFIAMSFVRRAATSSFCARQSRGRQRHPHRREDRGPARGQEPGRNHRRLRRPHDRARRSWHRSALRGTSIIQRRAVNLCLAAIKPVIVARTCWKA